MDKRLLDIVIDAIKYVKPRMNKDGFHTWKHIQYMFNYLKKYDVLSVELRLAVLFHDLGYVPGNSRNEAEAVVRFLKYMNTVENQDLVDLEKVCDMILATAEPFKVYEDEDTRRLIEADFSILATKETTELFRYERQIRDEYKNIQLKDYLEGRYLFLMQVVVKGVNSTMRNNADRLAEQIQNELNRL